MKGFKQISCTLVVIILFVDIAVSVPLVRVKRQDLELENDAAVDLNPIVSEDATSEGLDREKRKLPDAKFATKNAIIGFVFSKIDNLIDAKTRFIDQLDQTNIAKNKAYGIEVPKPINSFQDLFQAVLTPKIQAITTKLGSFSGSFLGGGSSFSGGTGAGGDDSAGTGSGAGLGGILSSVLKLSGPIFTSSIQSANSATPATSIDDGDDGF